METPGFAAEASLYRAEELYQMEGETSYGLTPANSAVCIRQSQSNHAFVSVNCELA